MTAPTKSKPTSIKKKAPVKRAAAKPATKAAAAAKPMAPKPAASQTPSAPIVSDTDAVEPQVLRKKELIERVVARSGIKKKDAKPTIEAMLAVLGEALSNGEELNLHPMGKMMVTRVIEKENATVMVTKVRRQKPNAGATVVKIAPKF